MSTSGPSGGTASPSEVTNYVANVLMPVSILNMDKPFTNQSLFFEGCPLVDSIQNVVVNGVSTLSKVLTRFGTFLLDLIVNEFNTIYGTQFTTLEAEIIDLPSSENDENSQCVYSVLINSGNVSGSIAIKCYVQVGIQTHVSLELAHFS
jgi:hypothetical protein